MAAPAKPAAKEAKKGPGEGRKDNYKVEGSTAKALNKSCPKCGPGFLLANHKDRNTCGKCGYTEKK